MQLSLISWKPMVRNSLRGFATIRLGKSLSMKDVTVHCSNGKKWASLPSKPQIGSDGNSLRDDRGKVKYTPILEWLDRDVANDFSQSVIEAVEAQHPGATDEQPA